MTNPPHFTSIETARFSMRDGEVFSFTFGTLAHYDRVMFVNRIPYTVSGTGRNLKAVTRLYVY